MYGISKTLPLYLVLAWLFPVAMICKNIVYEKEMRLKEVMRIMGLSNGVHWLAWFINAFIVMFVTVCLLVVILKVCPNVFCYFLPRRCTAAFKIMSIHQTICYIVYHFLHHLTDFNRIQYTVCRFAFHTKCLLWCIWLNSFSLFIASWHCSHSSLTSLSEKKDGNKRGLPIVTVCLLIHIAYYTVFFPYNITLLTWSWRAIYRVRWINLPWWYWCYLHVYYIYRIKIVCVC